MDWWNRIVEALHTPQFLKTFFDYWRYTAVGVVGALGVAGCSFFEPTVKSPTTGQPVGRIDLTIEIDAWNVAAQAKKAEFEARLAQLAEKEAQRSAIFNATIGTLAGTPIGVTPYFSMAAGLLATALGVDNLRKDRQIAARDDSLRTLGAVPTKVTVATTTTPVK